MSDPTITEWRRITGNSTSQRQSSLSTSVLLVFWISGCIWVVLPYYENGAFTASCNQITLNILTIVTTILFILSALFNKNHTSSQDIEHHTDLFTGQEVLRKFKSIPLEFARTIDPKDTYQVAYSLISHTDAEGDLHERYYALKIGSWIDIRKTIRFPKWVRLTPFTLSIPIILAALFHRTYHQFLDTSTSFSQLQLNPDQFAFLVFPCLSATGAISYALWLIYYIRLIRATPTFHAVE
ncbi:MAG: hypothetical protein RL173_699 [Fibrobacterota bacterium]|jgi:hypothetical protein